MKTSRKGSLRTKKPEKKTAKPKENITRNIKYAEDFKNIQQDEFSIYRTFFKIIFKNSYHDRDKLWKDISELQDIVEPLIDFYPVMTFGFIQNHLFLPLLDCKIIKSFLLLPWDQKNFRTLCNKFIQKYEYAPVNDLIQNQELSTQQKKQKFKEYMEFLVEKYRYQRAKFCTMDVYKEITKKVKECRHSYSFIDGLYEYDFGRRLKLVDDKGNAVEHKPIVKRYTFSKSKTTTLFSFHSLEEKMFSYLRPWILEKNWEIEIQPICDKGSQYSQNKTEEGWWAPHDSFHKNYFNSKNKQEKTTFFLLDEENEFVPFLIRYKFSDGRIFLQDEDLFKKQMQWKKNPFVHAYQLETICYPQMSHADHFLKILETEFIKVLEPLISKQIDLNCLVECILTQIPKTTMGEILTHAFRFLSVCIVPYFPSFIWKINQGFLHLDQFYDFEDGLVYPELFLYTAKNDISNMMDYERTQFFHKIMFQYCKSLCNLSFVKKSNLKKPESVEILSLSTKDQIYVQEKFLSICSIEEDGPWSEWIDYDIAYNGVDSIDVFVEPLFYWKKKVMIPPMEIPSVKVISEPKPKSCLSISELESLLLMIETKKEVCWKAKTPIKEENSSEEDFSDEEKEIDEELMLEDKLEDEEIDRDEFYGPPEEVEV